MPHESHGPHLPQARQRSVSPMRRRCGLVAVVATLAMTVMPAVLPAGTAQAAPVQGFNPGNIVSDAVFFNSSAMSAGDVQAFLDDKVERCSTGYTCLKDYAQATSTRPADQYCSGYVGAGRETAATIIAKSASACGINPQVVLVMLQKEQGLVTSTAPSSTRYDKAMGFACPDTAACNTAYYGLQNQIYSAVRQFRVYERSFSHYGPYRTATLRYHPNVACGGSPVYVENQATANLYYYTPYQPNAAALAAGKGTGDACSAYGNRNFYIYFSEWFGSSQGFTVTGALRDYWLANGGAGGPIGAPTSLMLWTGSGWYQQFGGADLYLRALEGRVVVPVRGSIRGEYRTVGEMKSGLGWPVGPEYSIRGGAYQDFEGGRIFAKSGVSTFAIAAPMYAAHENTGNVGGPLGWPTSRARPFDTGSIQTFEGGTIYARDDESAYVLTTDLDELYGSVGGPGGTLGWVRSGLVPDRVGSHVVFDGGWIQKAGSNVWLVKGQIGAHYVAAGGIDGPLGAVKGPEVWHPSGGWSQEFENGSVYSSAAGTFSVTQGRQALADAGGVAAAGFPVEEVRTSGTTWSQRFGTVTFTSEGTGVVVVRGAIKRLYDQMGGASSGLGVARSGERAIGPGFVQDFAGGQIWCGPKALVALDARTVEVHRAAGGSTGRLGWPVSSRIAEPGGFRQEFEGGTIAGSSTPGGPVATVVGGVRTVYLANQGPRVVGYPTGVEQQVAGTWKQVFERGAVYLPLSGQPGSVVGGRIWEAYVAAGAEANAGLGLPVASATTTTSGVTKQVFSSSTFFSSSAGTFVVRGLMRTVFSQHGAEAGRLGVPLESERAVGPGFVQRFAGGTVYVSPWAVQATWGAIGAEYQRRGGVTGALGWPLGPEVTSAGRWSQRFQNGTLVLLSDGTYRVE